MWTKDKGKERSRWRWQGGKENDADKAAVLWFSVVSFLLDAREMET